MTTPQDDRRRQRAGILVALALAIVAAWLVLLWLDGSDSTVSGGVFPALVDLI